MIDKEANSTRHGEKASFILKERWLPIYFHQRATTTAAANTSIHDMREKHANPM